MKLIILLFFVSSCITAETQLKTNNETLEEKLAEVNPRINLKWERPSLNADGTPAANLKGFKIQYQEVGRTNSSTIDVGNRTQYEIEYLAKGTYHFSILTYDKFGKQSPLGSFGDVEVK